MTAESSIRVPAPSGGGHPALSRLVRLPVAAFAGEYWGRAPLVSSAADLPHSFADLFSPDAVDELVSQRGLRTPFLRVAKGGRTYSDRAFTDGGGIGAAVTDQVSDDKLLRLFADGATMVLQGLHRTWPALTTFTQQLAADLGHPVQANAYVTPPQNTGFSDHYDVHDVFVLQVGGEKRWRVHEPVRRDPLRDEPWTDHQAAVEAAALTDPLLELTLRPGDCLYLPRGYLHAASALGGVSTHLTLGIHPWTRRQVADDLVAQALRRLADDPAMRQSLPLGVDLGDADDLAGPVELVRAALRTAIDALGPEDLVDALGARSRRTQRAAPVGPVAQSRAAAAAGDLTTVVLRQHLAPVLQAQPGGDSTLVSRAAPVPLPAHESEVVRRLLLEGSAAVSDLGPDLTRRLLLAGVVVPG
ncbi:MAG: cupin domain-containing protein [Lapillicoccus sp.]